MPTIVIIDVVSQSYCKNKTVQFFVSNGIILMVVALCSFAVLNGMLTSYRYNEELRWISTIVVEF